MVGNVPAFCGESVLGAVVRVKLGHGTRKSPVWKSSGCVGCARIGNGTVVQGEAWRVMVRSVRLRMGLARQAQARAEPN